MYKALLNVAAFIVYTIVIANTRHCLYDNYDLNVYGICSQCEGHPQAKWTGTIALGAVLLATIILGRSVSCGGCVGGRSVSCGGCGGGMCVICGGCEWSYMYSIIGGFSIQVDPFRC